MIVVVGLSHRTAPLQVRERIALPRERLPDMLTRLTAGSTPSEALVLSTCNRFEIYAACQPSREPARETASLSAAMRTATEVIASFGGSVIVPHLATLSGPAAVEHLFRVAASLDSLVVGEPQILGQLKDAIEVARESRVLGPTLSSAMRRAVRVGKRVRTETAIGSGQVSVPSVAIDLARQIFGDLSGRSALIVGAGEMAEAAAKLLVKAGASLQVVNRSEARGALLAREVGGEAYPWEQLERRLVDADIVVSSTSSPKIVLTLEMLQRVRKARRGRSLFLIDIAVPRDIDPAANDLDNMFLYDIDDLSQIVAQSLQGRHSEAARAEAIVAEEARGFETWSRERELAPTISALHAHVRQVLAAELDRSLTGKLRHLGESDHAALSRMLDAATNKLLHVPVTRLRSMAGDDRAGDYTEALRSLFDLEPTSADSPAQAGDDRLDVGDHADGHAGLDPAPAAAPAPALSPAPLRASDVAGGDSPPRRAGSSLTSAVALSSSNKRPC